MKITVGLPSRGRPLELAAAILALDKTRTQGAHEVDYIIAHDHNDPDTLAIVDRLVGAGLPIRSCFGARPLGLGELHNDMAMMAGKDAVFMLWSDRLVPVTEDWDHAIATTVMQYPTRVTWLDSIHLVGPGQFILPPAWRAALPGPPCPGYFPFWFEDSAVEEVDAFVHGLPRVACWAKCAGPRTAKTTRCRDLEFWIRFYGALRPRRIAEAAQAARNLGLPVRDVAALVDSFDRRDAAFIGRAPSLMEQFGATGEPDGSYLAAKNRAVAIIKEMAGGDALREAAE